jgi:hypothetical protein
MHIISIMSFIIKKKKKTIVFLLLVVIIWHVTEDLNGFIYEILGVNHSVDDMICFAHSGKT